MANRKYRRIFPNEQGSTTVDAGMTKTGLVIDKTDGASGFDPQVARSALDQRGIHSREKQETTLGVADDTLAVVADFVVLTGDVGGNTLDTITGGVGGQILVILFADNLVTITDDPSHAADTISFGGVGDHAGKTDTYLCLVHDETSWYAKPMTRTMTYCMGGRMAQTGRFAIANGTAPLNNVASQVQTRHPVTALGVVTSIAYNVQSGATDSQFKIHVSGVVAATFFLSPGVFSNVGVVTLATPVVVDEGDTVELEYDNGTTTNDSVFTILGIEA